MGTTKKDFTWAAEYVRNMRKRGSPHSEDEAREVENAFVEFFNHTGERFMVDRFREACKA